MSLSLSISLPNNSLIMPLSCIRVDRSPFCSSFVLVFLGGGGGVCGTHRFSFLCSVRGCFFFYFVSLFCTCESDITDVTGLPILDDLFGFLYLYLLKKLP